MDTAASPDKLAPVMGDEGGKLLDEVVRDHGRYLWGLSYRMTGNAADADEIVQETFARAVERPPLDRTRPWRPWLATVAVNLSRDRLRRRRRRPYEGPWLPSPIETGSTPEADAPDSRYGRMESLTSAFLLALEELTPRQRAVLLLRDVYEYSVRETADALELSEANVKVILHRARKAMAGYDAARPSLDADAKARHAEALERFLAAIAAGDVGAATAALSEDAVTLNDGGGELLAARRPVVGADRVARFVLGTSRKAAGTPRMETREINGLPAVVATLDGTPDRVADRVVLQAEVDARGRITRLLITLAPRKLTAIRFPG